MVITISDLATIVPRIGIRGMGIEGAFTTGASIKQRVCAGCLFLRRQFLVGPCRFLYCRTVSDYFARPISGAAVQ